MTMLIRKSDADNPQHKTHINVNREQGGGELIRAITRKQYMHMYGHPDIRLCGRTCLCKKQARPLPLIEFRAEDERDRCPCSTLGDCNANGANERSRVRLFFPLEPTTDWREACPRNCFSRYSGPMPGPRGRSHKARFWANAQSSGQISQGAF